MPAQPSPAPPRFGALDGIRGLAAVLVVVTHVGFETGASFRGAWGALAARADVGVAIFFVLSGFLLYRPFAAAHLTTNPAPATTRFLWHRLLRIYPAYLLVLAVILVVHHRDDLSVRLALSNLLLLQTYSPDLLLPELAQSWTLSTEAAWYLALPVLGLLLLRRPARRSPRRQVAFELAACVAFAAGSLAYAVIVRGTQLLDPYVSGYWLPHYLGWFGLGMAMAVLHAWRSANPGSARRLSELGSAPGSCWLLAAALYALACTPVTGPRGLTALAVWDGLARDALYGAVACFVVLPAVFGSARHSLGLSALGSRPMRYLGDVSYALYLWHFPLVPVAFRLTGTEEFTGGFWLNLAVVLALSLPVAALSWHLVERPVLRARSWSPRRRVQSSVTAEDMPAAPSAVAASS